VVMGVGVFLAVVTEERVATTAWIQADSAEGLLLMGGGWAREEI
jgi:hypothetical protein